MERMNDMATTSTNADIRMPVASLAALRRSLRDSVGPDAAAQALQRAGFAAGDALHPALTEPDEDLAELTTGDFFRRLTHLFRRMGWGDLQHESLHPGVGALQADNWFEAETAEGASRPSCFFTTGVLANLLGRTAGADVAVLQAECRAAGHDHCRFLFGSRDALSAVYADLAEGRTLEDSLAALG